MTTLYVSPYPMTTLCEPLAHDHCVCEPLVHDQCV